MQYQEPETPEGPRASQAALNLNNYGAKCREKQQYACAEIAFRRIVAMHPDVPVFWSNLGAVLLDQNKHPEVEQVLRKAIVLDPLDPKMVGNLALTLSHCGQYNEAMELFDKALSLSPNDSVIRWNRNCTELSQGNWSNLPEYVKLRPKALGEDYFKNTPFPYWNGKDDLNGKTIFVQFDQGLGDRILYSRFVYALKQKYPNTNILALTYERMNALFWGFQEQGVMTLLPEKIPFPKADYGIYVDDLAAIHGISPDNVPPEPGIMLQYTEGIAAKMAPGFPMPLTPSLKVGICWTGNTGMPRNRERSIPLELMLQLAEIPNISLYSLQAGAGAQDVERLGANGLLHSGAGFGASLEEAGISFTAAVIMNLDVVVTCCTSIAHLSGALGVPTWLLLCQDPYWIWLKEGDTTAWYPSMTLFRQPEPRAWKPVIDTVKELLGQVADNLLREQTS